LGPELGGGVAQGSGYALASAASVAMMLMVGFLVFARSPSSAVNRSFMGIVAACCLWMGGRVGIFGSLTASEAADWHKLSFVGLSFTPAMIYLFACSAAGSTARKLRSITLAFAVSTGLSLFSFVRPDLIGRVAENPYTGWYPRFSYGGIFFLAFLAVGTAGAARVLFWSHVPRSPSRMRERRRVHLILLGLVTGYTAAFDFLPAFGFIHPPVAHFSLLVGVAFCGYAVGRYRVVVLTPKTTGEAVMGSMHEALFFLDLDGRILFTNGALRRLLGYSEDALVGERVHTLFSPDRKVEMDLGPRGRGASGDQRAEFRSKMGVDIPATLTVTPYFDDEGETVGFVGLARNESGQIHLENRVEELSCQMEQVLGNAMLGVYMISDGRIEFVNQKAAEMVGYSVDEVKEMGLVGLIHPDDREAVQTKVALREKGERPENHYVLRAVDKNGQTKELDVFSTTIPRDGRHVILGFCLDVTDQERVREERDRLREFNRWVLRNLPVGILTADRQGRIASINPKACALIGAGSADTLKGRHLRDTLLGGEPHLEALFPEDGEAAGEESAALDDILFETEDGRRLSLWVLSAPSLLGAGPGYFVVIQDGEAASGDGTPGTRRGLDKQIRLLLGGMARDFDGLLGGILGYASLARALLPEEEKVCSHIDAISESAHRALSLTKQLAAARGEGYASVEEIPVGEVVQKTLGWLADRLDPSIELATSLSDGDAVVEGDPDWLQEVLVQLGLNARDAMPEGGTLRVTTEEIHLDGCFGRCGDEIRPGYYVCISVSDTGGGIPDDIRDRVFDPFFTTKGRGVTGVGLWMARSIVRQHGGTIGLESEPGRGSSFRVYLPVATPRKPATHETAGDVGEKEGRVLIVDDEPSVREVASELLQELGYTVFTASDGAEALDLVRREKSVNVVVLDMVMPKLNGEETFARLQRVSPGTKVIISSGYTEDEKIRELLARGAHGFVQKPYRVQTLARAVDDALAAEVPAT